MIPTTSAILAAADIFIKSDSISSLQIKLQPTYKDISTVSTYEYTYIHVSYMMYGIGIISGNDMIDKLTEQDLPFLYS